MAVISLRACCSGTPGFRRATVFIQCARRIRTNTSGLTPIGVQNCTPELGKKKSGGMTPLTITDRPLRMMLRPTTCGSAAKKFCQVRYARTMNRSLPSNVWS